MQSITQTQEFYNVVTQRANGFMFILLPFVLIFGQIVGAVVCILSTSAIPLFDTALVCTYDALHGYFYSFAMQCYSCHS